MKRILRIKQKNNIEVKFITNDETATWYFVNWDNDVKDENDNYVIYTNKNTFGEKKAIFKSKDWGVVCRIGNLINGSFHEYFSIGNSYTNDFPINIDDLRDK